jgi:hypothetical protein
MITLGTRHASIGVMHGRIRDRVASPCARGADAYALGRRAWEPTPSSGELAPGAASQPPSWPAPPLLDPPKPIRAIYVNAWAFGERRFDELVKLADTTEINAFVIDVKDDTGFLTYRSSVPTAVEIGANDQRRARDTERRLRVLSEHGIYPIARSVVAKDPLLAARKPAWSVQHVNGDLWRDRLNFAWVDAFNDSIWIYAASWPRRRSGWGLLRCNTTTCASR